MLHFAPEYIKTPIHSSICLRDISYADSEIEYNIVPVPNVMQICIQKVLWILDRKMFQHKNGRQFIIMCNFNVDHTSHANPIDVEYCLNGFKHLRYCNLLLLFYFQMQFDKCPLTSQMFVECEYVPQHNDIQCCVC